MKFDWGDIIAIFVFIWMIWSFFHDRIRNRRHETETELREARFDLVRENERNIERNKEDIEKVNLDLQAFKLQSEKYYLDKETYNKRMDNLENSLKKISDSVIRLETKIEGI